MSSRIGLVGHCGADTSYLRIAVSRAVKGAAVSVVEDDAALERSADQLDLLLVNRQLDWGFTTDEGVELIRQLRQKHPQLRMMLISNYPDAQDAAVLAGALPGFGKGDLGSPEVAELLRSALEQPATR